MIVVDVERAAAGDSQGVNLGEAGSGSKFERATGDRDVAIGGKSAVGCYDERAGGDIGAAGIGISSGQFGDAAAGDRQAKSRAIVADTRLNGQGIRRVIGPRLARAQQNARRAGDGVAGYVDRVGSRSGLNGDTAGKKGQGIRAADDDRIGAGGSEGQAVDAEVGAERGAESSRAVAGRAEDDIGDPPAGNCMKVGAAVGGASIGAGAGGGTEFGGPDQSGRAGLSAGPVSGRRWCGGVGDG